MTENIESMGDESVDGVATGISWERATDGMSPPSESLGANFAVRRFAPIVFSVKRHLWRKNDDNMEAADAEYRAKRESRLQKGNYQCVFCGFRSKHTEIHHKNDNHADNRSENLIVADPLCHGTQHIGQVGSKRHGLMIEVGGLPQAELNHLQRTIAVVLEIGTDAEKREASTLLQHLASRGELVIKVWGSANPSDFANAMLELKDHEMEKRESAFAGLGMLYRPSRFVEYIGRWIDELYKSLPTNTWQRIHDRAVGNQ
ncbi:HNH endonuclease [Cupriavidus taiwanensis]|uniref:TraT-like type IV secretion system protein (IcmJ/DotN protein) n=1 Tax=Cupriavidus taiwanensis TaxID=164546 RepID=A0A7Z7NR18_9BURK|nr:HNH endonuclease [Cupriavidus taiwanensis]SOZ17256.1 TraT-like type IV secretion system protein (IcmJ/DotN protein) [Cupriavidus taiwanensis]SOZ96416.1 TraT-like type IV secretion system protein (IcmJ/DotN protein) [Cupriavidus taiwanensis]SPC25639.1 TraT-like type IV secretion system protein (IcmJ/DotN protein) [Cupriavidus taiwanensis]